MSCPPSCCSSAAAPVERRPPRPRRRAPASPRPGSLPGRLRWAEQGSPDGEPIIMLHGLTDSWQSFSRVLPELPSRYRVLVPDQRGHGGSERPAVGYAPEDFATDVLAFMDAVGVERAALVGHSMGSFVAQAVARPRPADPGWCWSGRPPACARHNWSRFVGGEALTDRFGGVRPGVQLSTLPAGAAGIPPGGGRGEPPGTGAGLRAATAEILRSGHPPPGRIGRGAAALQRARRSGPGRSRQPPGAAAGPRSGSIPAWATRRTGSAPRSSPATSTHFSPEADAGGYPAGTRRGIIGRGATGARDGPSAAVRRQIRGNG
jgi:pimeloyl-ACP methyl ester carboxylesterase